MSELDDWASGDTAAAQPASAEINDWVAGTPADAPSGSRFMNPKYSGGAAPAFNEDGTLRFDKKGKMLYRPTPEQQRQGSREFMADHAMESAATRQWLADNPAATDREQAYKKHKEVFGNAAAPQDRFEDINRQMAGRADAQGAFEDNGRSRDLADAKKQFEEQFPGQRFDEDDYKEMSNMAHAGQQHKKFIIDQAKLAGAQIGKDRFDAHKEMGSSTLKEMQRQAAAYPEYKEKLDKYQASLDKETNAIDQANAADTAKFEQAYQEKYGRPPSPEVLKGYQQTVKEAANADLVDRHKKDLKENGDAGADRRWGGQRLALAGVVSAGTNYVEKKQIEKELNSGQPLNRFTAQNYASYMNEQERDQDVEKKTGLDRFLTKSLDFGSKLPAMGLELALTSPASIAAKAGGVASTKLAAQYALGGRLGAAVSEGAGWAAGTAAGVAANPHYSGVPMIEKMTPQLAELDTAEGVKKLIVAKEGEGIETALPKAITEQAIFFGLMGAGGKSMEVVGDAIGKTRIVEALAKMPLAQRTTAIRATFANIAGNAVGKGSSFPGVLDMRAAEVLQKMVGVRDDAGLMGRIASGDKGAWMDFAAEATAFAAFHTATNQIKSGKKPEVAIEQARVKAADALAHRGEPTFGENAYDNQPSVTKTMPKAPEASGAPGGPESKLTEEAKPETKPEAKAEQQENPAWKAEFEKLKKLGYGDEMAEATADMRHERFAKGEAKAAEPEPEHEPETKKEFSPPEVGAPESPEAKDNLYHIADYKNPSKSLKVGMDLLDKKAANGKEIWNWDGDDPITKMDTNLRPEGVAFHMDRRHFRTIDKGEDLTPGTSRQHNPGEVHTRGEHALRYDPALKSIVWGGSEADAGYAQLRDKVAEINRERADPQMMKDYTTHGQTLPPVKLETIDHHRSTKPWSKYGVEAGHESTAEAPASSEGRPEPSVGQPASEKAPEAAGEAPARPALTPEQHGELEQAARMTKAELKKKYGTADLGEVADQVAGLNGDRRAAQPIDPETDREIDEAGVSKEHGEAIKALLGGQSLRDAADSLGVSHEAVRTRAAQALRALKKANPDKWGLYKNVKEVIKDAASNRYARELEKRQIESPNFRPEDQLTEQETTDAVREHRLAGHPRTPQGLVQRAKAEAQAEVAEEAGRGIAGRTASLRRPAPGGNEGGGEAGQAPDAAAAARPQAPEGAGPGPAPGGYAQTPNGLKQEVNQFQMPGAKGKRGGQGTTTQAVAAPADAGTTARGIIRHHNSERQARADRDAAALDAGERFFLKDIDAEPDPAIKKHKFQTFMDALESNNTANLPKEQKEFADTYRRLKDEYTQMLEDRDLVQSVIDNHVGHLWADPNSPKTTMDQIAATLRSKRPLSGKEGFRKARTIPTYGDGLAAGLEPKDWNPGTLAKMEFDQYSKAIFGHDAFDELKEQGLARFVKLGDKKPDSWRTIEDKLFRVLAPGEAKRLEYFDKGQVEGLRKLADDLKIDVKTSDLGKGVLGQSGPGGVERAFGSPEEVLAHELGHQIADRYGMNAWAHDPTMAQELQNLADLRASGQVDPAYRQYLRSPQEAAANLVAAYFHAPELLAKIAPTAKANLEQTIQAHPELHAMRDIKPGLEIGVGEQMQRLAGPVLTGHYYMPNEVAKLLENHLSPGLAGLEGATGAAYRAFRGFGNIMSQFKLGWSAFHAHGTALNAQFSAIAEAMGMATRGDFSQALAKVPESVLPLAAAGKAVRQGMKIRSEWDMPGSQSPDIQEMVQYMKEAGARARGGDEHLGSQIGQLQRALAKIQGGQYGKIPEALARALPALNQLASKPIMEKLVPLTKLGVAADAIRYELSKNPNMDLNQRREVFGKIWDAMDDRFGLLTYDNLFMNRAVKDGLQAGMLSFGWNLGDARALGGGALAAVSPKTWAGLAKGEGLNRKVGFLVSMMAGTAMYGALYQFLRTGKKPEEIKDLFFPKTGNVGKDGTPERMSMPTYMKDLASVAQGVGDGPLKIPQNLASMAHGKMGPAVQLLAELMNNKDWRGAAITDPTDSWSRQSMDVGKHILSAFEPISINQFRRGKAEGKSPWELAQSFVGMTPTPYRLSHTDEELRKQEHDKKYEMTPQERRRKGLKAK